VKVKVIGIETPAEDKPAKIALSIKQLQEDPWDSVEEKFKTGDAVRGRVTRCLNFGAFVEIAPGVEGLIHISEMSYTRRVHRCEDVVNPGDLVTTVIKGIEAEKKRIALSLRDAEGDPWSEVLERFPAGQTTQGVIEKKEKFGYFVRLAAGVTGLLPLSVIRRSPAGAEIEKNREGDSITVVVEEVNLQKRRISLAPAGSADEADWQRFAREPRASMGSMAEKLQSALSDKRRRS
jgi:small subunit ribosomal protein S1